MMRPATASQHCQLHVPCDAALASVPSALVGASSIDSPAMWLDDEIWDSLRRRFSQGPQRPARWPKPDVVSVCTSPEFVVPNLAAD